MNVNVNVNDNIIIVNGNLGAWILRRFGLVYEKMKEGKKCVGYIAS